MAPHVCSKLMVGATERKGLWRTPMKYLCTCVKMVVNKIKAVWSVGCYGHITVNWIYQACYPIQLQYTWKSCYIYFDSLLRVSKTLHTKLPVCPNSYSSVCDLNRTPIVMAKHGGSCVHFSGIPTCERTSRDTVSHPQRPPLPTLYIIS